MIRLLPTKYEDVWLFYPVQDGVFYLSASTEDCIFKKLYKNGQVIDKQFKGNIKLLDSTFFSYQSEARHSLNVLDISENRFYSLDAKHLIHFSENNQEGLLYDIDSDWRVKNGYGHVNETEFRYTFVRDSINIISLFSKEFYFISFNNEERRFISKFSTKACKIEWTFPLNEIGRWHNTYTKQWEAGKIQHLAGVLDGILWMDVEGHSILGLDVGTGELKHKLNKAHQVIGVPQNEWHTALPLNFATFLDYERKKFFGFVYDMYVEVELSGSEPLMTFHLFSEYCNTNQVHHAYRENRCCFDRTHFYFVDPMSGRIACFNRETKTFDWTYAFPEGSTMGFLMDIKVTDKNLYVLDSGGTLHVFEKEAV